MLVVWKTQYREGVGSAQTHLQSSCNPTQNSSRRERECGCACACGCVGVRVRVRVRAWVCVCRCAWVRVGACVRGLRARAWVRARACA